MDVCFAALSLPVKSDAGVLRRVAACTRVRKRVAIVLTRP